MFSNPFYFILIRLLFLLHLYPGFIYAQQSSCFVTEQNKQYCLIYDPDTGWREVFCANEPRCAGSGDVTDFYQKVCIQDDEDKRYCHVVDINSSRYVPCDSESSCAQYLSPNPQTEVESSSPGTRRGGSNLFQEAEGIFRDMERRREEFIREIEEQERRNYINYIEKVKHYIRTESESVADMFHKNLETNLKKALYSSKTTHKKKLKKTNEIAKQIPSSFIDHILEKTAFQDLVNEGLMSAEAVNEWINNVIRRLELDAYEQISDFRQGALEKEKEERLKNLFSNSAKDLSISDLITRAGQMINEVEKGIRHINDNPLPALDHIHLKENRILEATEKIEENLYKQAKTLMDKHVLEASKTSLTENINFLSQSVEESVGLAKGIDIQPVLRESPSSTYHNKGIAEIVQDILKSKHDRRKLGLLDDEGFSPPDEEPYEFQSPEGEFLEKNKELYSKLYSANPFHEQGIRARDIGLSAVEVADEEYVQGNESTAEMAFQVAEVAADITLGLLPYVGLGKDVYEAFTGKHLLTGRDLTDFERALSVVGIALSAGTGGVLSSGAIKLSLQQTGRVFRKINEKLVKKTVQALKGSSLEKVVQEYPKAFFRSVENIGLKTKQEIQSAVHFLKRAFSGENPSIDKVSGVIKFTKKSGIENYTKLIDELKAMKDISLPPAGEEFLARLFRSGKQMSKKELVRVGKAYSLAAKHLGTTIKPVSFPKPGESGKVWRVVKAGSKGSSGKSYTHTPDTVFDFHPGMPLKHHRYSARGKSALFTSLDKETALKEFAEHQGKNALKAPRIVRSTTVNVDNVLDLNDDTLEILKISENDIRKKLIEHSDAYVFPDLIREISEKRGFKAILAPSAPNDEGWNLIIFSKEALRQ